MSGWRTRLARRLASVPRSTLAFAAAAVAILAISFALTLRARPAPAAAPKRFSGSSVVLRMPSILSDARLPTRVRVAIVRDDAALDYYDSPLTLDTIVRRWRETLAAAGADARIVSPGGIRGAGAHVIVVPSSPCLTLATREAIEMAGARGQGLIVTGMVGTHDAGCRRIGYGLLVALTGASRAEPLNNRSMVYVSIPGGSPLAADIPPGSRLDVSPASQVALRLPARDAFYSSYTHDVQGVRGEPYFDAALARSTYRGARVVYFGFELRDALRSAWNRGVLRVLVRNAAAWAAGAPAASVESWPMGRRAAVVFAQDVEQGFENARHALDSLRAAGVRGTFFVTSDLALRNRRLTRRLAEHGEIGTHSENHSLLGGAPFERQLERLHITQRDLTELLELPVRGLRPPEEQFDEATMAAWLGAGGTYLLGANDARCAAPELLPVRGDTLLLIPRVFGDDFAVAGPGHRRSPAVVEKLFRSELAKAKSAGGLYVISYHSQLLARDEYVPTLASLARAAAGDSTIWTTSADVVAEWWLSRSALQLAVRRPAPDRITVTVSNPARRVIENAVVRVVLPPGYRVQSASVPHLESEAGVARLRVRFLPGRARTTLTLQLAR